MEPEIGGSIDVVTRLNEQRARSEPLVGENLAYFLTERLDEGGIREELYTCSDRFERRSKRLWNSTPDSLKGLSWLKKTNPNTNALGQDDALNIFGARSILIEDPPDKSSTNIHFLFENEYFTVTFDSSGNFKIGEIDSQHHKELYTLTKTEAIRVFTTALLANNKLDSNRMRAIVESDLELDELYVQALKKASGDFGTFPLPLTLNSPAANTSETHERVSKDTGELLNTLAQKLDAVTKIVGGSEEKAELYSKLYQEKVWEDISPEKQDGRWLHTAPSKVQRFTDSAIEKSLGIQGVEFLDGADTNEIEFAIHFLGSDAISVGKISKDKSLSYYNNIASNPQTKRFLDNAVVSTYHLLCNTEKYKDRQGNAELMQVDTKGNGIRFEDIVNSFVISSDSKEILKKALNYVDHPTPPLGIDQLLLDVELQKARESGENPNSSEATIETERMWQRVPEELRHDIKFGIDSSTLPQPEKRKFNIERVITVAEPESKNIAFGVTLSKWGFIKGLISPDGSIEFEDPELEKVMAEYAPIVKKEIIGAYVDGLVQTGRMQPETTAPTEPTPTQQEREAQFLEKRDYLGELRTLKESLLTAKSRSQKERTTTQIIDFFNANKREDVALGSLEMGLELALDKDFRDNGKKILAVLNTALLGTSQIERTISNYELLLTPFGTQLDTISRQLSLLKSRKVIGSEFLSTEQYISQFKTHRDELREQAKDILPRLEKDKKGEFLKPLDDKLRFLHRKIGGSDEMADMTQKLSQSSIWNNVPKRFQDGNWLNKLKDTGFGFPENSFEYKLGISNVGFIGGDDIPGEITFELGMQGTDTIYMGIIGKDRDIRFLFNTDSYGPEFKRFIKQLVIGPYLKLCDSEVPDTTDNVLNAANATLQNEGYSRADFINAFSSTEGQKIMEEALDYSDQLQQIEGLDDLALSLNVIKVREQGAVPPEEDYISKIEKLWSEVPADFKIPKEDLEEREDPKIIPMQSSILGINELKIYHTVRTGGIYFGQRLREGAVISGIVSPEGTFTFLSNTTEKILGEYNDLYKLQVLEAFHAHLVEQGKIVPSEEVNSMEETVQVPPTPEAPKLPISSYYGRLLRARPSEAGPILDELLYEANTRTDQFSYVSAVNIALELIGSKDRRQQEQAEKIINGLSENITALQQILPVTTKRMYPDSPTTNGETEWKDLIQTIIRRKNVASLNPRNANYIAYVDALIGEANASLQNYDSGGVALNITEHVRDLSPKVRASVLSYYNSANRSLNEARQDPGDANKFYKLFFDLELPSFSIEPSEKPIKLLTETSFGTGFSLRDIMREPDAQRAKVMAEEFSKTVPKGDYVWQELTQNVLIDNFQKAREGYQIFTDAILREKTAEVVPVQEEPKPPISSYYGRILRARPEEATQLVDELAAEVIFNRTDHYSRMAAFDVGLQLVNSTNSRDQQRGDLLFRKIEDNLFEGYETTPLFSKVAFATTGTTNGEQEWNELLGKLTRHLSEARTKRKNAPYVRTVEPILEHSQQILSKYNPTNVFVYAEKRDGFDEYKKYQESVSTSIATAKETHDPERFYKVFSMEALTRPDKPIPSPLLMTATFGGEFTIQDIMREPDDEKAQQMASEFYRNIPRGDFLWQEFASLVLTNDLGQARKQYQEFLEGQQKETLSTETGTREQTVEISPVPEVPKPPISSYYGRILRAHPSGKEAIVHELAEEANSKRYDEFSYMSAINIGFDLLLSTNRRERELGIELFKNMLNIRDNSKQKYPVISKVNFMVDETTDGKQEWDELLNSMTRKNALLKARGMQDVAQEMALTINAGRSGMNPYSPSLVYVDDASGRIAGDNETQTYFRTINEKVKKIKEDPQTSTFLELFSVMSKPTNMQTSTHIPIPTFTDATFETGFSLKEILIEPDNEKASQMAQEFLKAIPSGDYVWHEVTQLLLVTNFEGARKDFQLFAESEILKEEIAHNHEEQAETRKLLQENIMARIELILSQLSDEEKGKVFFLSNEVTEALGKYIVEQGISPFTDTTVSVGSTVINPEIFGPIVTRSKYTNGSTANTRDIVLEFLDEEARFSIKSFLQPDGTIHLDGENADNLSTRFTKYAQLASYINMLKADTNFNYDGLPQEIIDKQLELTTLINKAQGNISTEQQAPTLEETLSLFNNLTAKYSAEAPQKEKEETLLQLENLLNSNLSPQLYIKFLHFGYTKFNSFNKNERQDGKRLVETFESNLKNMDQTQLSAFIAQAHEVMSQDRQMTIAIGRMRGQSIARGLQLNDNLQTREFLDFAKNDASYEVRNMQQQALDALKDKFKDIGYDKKEEWKSRLVNARQKIWPYVPRQYRTYEWMSNEKPTYIEVDKESPASKVMGFRYAGITRMDGDKELRASIVIGLENLERDGGLIGGIERNGHIKLPEIDNEGFEQEYIKHQIFSQYIGYLIVSGKMNMSAAPMEIAEEMGAIDKELFAFLTQSEVPETLPATVAESEIPVELSSQGTPLEIWENDLQMLSDEEKGAYFYEVKEVTDEYAKIAAEAASTKSPIEKDEAISVTFPSNSRIPYLLPLASMKAYAQTTNDTEGFRIELASAKGSSSLNFFLTNEGQITLEGHNNDTLSTRAAKHIAISAFMEMLEEREVLRHRDLPSNTRQKDQVQADRLIKGHYLAEKEKWMQMNDEERKQKTLDQIKRLNIESSQGLTASSLETAIRLSRRAWNEIPARLKNTRWMEEGRIYDGAWNERFDYETGVGEKIVFTKISEREVGLEFENIHNVTGTGILQMNTGQVVIEGIDRADYSEVMSILEQRIRADFTLMLIDEKLMSADNFMNHMKTLAKEMERIRKEYELKNGSMYVVEKIFQQPEEAQTLEDGSTNEARARTPRDLSNVLSSTERRPEQRKRRIKVVEADKAIASLFDGV